MIIAFMGNDGSGKTTLARKLLENLRASGFDVRYKAEFNYFLLDIFSKLFRKERIYKIKKLSLVREDKYRKPPYFKLWPYLVWLDLLAEWPWNKLFALYYNAADLLVHTAYHEDFGFPFLEAMASGLPVIAGNRIAIPEVVGDAGILLDPFDVNGFAYWMHEVLTNEDLKAKLSEKGYRRSMNFSWEKCARETLEVYREVLNEV
jgi:glycosyltransferase involved in cell wall biosynthesis